MHTEFEVCTPPLPRSQGFDALSIIRIDQFNKSNESSALLMALYCRDSNSWKKKKHLMWVSIDLGSWSIVISEADGRDAEGGGRAPVTSAQANGHAGRPSVALTAEPNGNERE